MKSLSFLTLLGLLPVLVSADGEPLKPLGERHQIDLRSIEEIQTVSSGDGEISIKVVTSMVGGNTVPYHHFCSVTDSYHEFSMGDYLHITNFDLGRTSGIEKPLRLEKVEDRLYRFSYTAWTSDSTNHFAEVSTYDIHLEKNGKLARMVETVVYSSFWDMEGSKMGLVASGPHRSIYYVEPKPGLETKPGGLFFSGAAEGNRYHGMVFKPQWDEEALVAEGEIRDDGKTLILKARATEWADDSKVPVGPTTTHILRFKSKADLPPDE